MTIPSAYRSTDIAILVPTKDRPSKMRAFLESLCAQTVRCGRVVIVDGGTSIAGVVSEYAGRLPIEYLACQPSGQIRQRNMGIAALDEGTPLVATMDDDIVFEPDALEQMLTLWNRVEPETAAISFNIINTPPEPNTTLRRFFGLAGHEPGRVLPSGMTTSNCQAVADYRCEWVCGGATVWRLDVLRKHPHREVPSRWAIAEDAIFSYPLSRLYPLWVCSSAKVRHEHVFDYSAPQPHRFHGLTQTLWLFHFVESNPELSVRAFIWTVFGSATARVFSLQHRHVQFAWGQLEAVAKAIAARGRGNGVVTVIEQEARSFQSRPR